jgi:rare lipoprotein A
VLPTSLDTCDHDGEQQGRRPHEHCLEQVNKKVAVLISVVILCSVTLGGCRKRHRGSIAHRIPQQTAPSRKPGNIPAAVQVGYTEQGIASWYGVPYHGRPAADGEIYDMETLVAAHRVLPFNTWLKVTNLANNQSVNVRVIDRGPFVKGRFLDLSKAAARSIGLLGPGVGEVRIEVIAAPKDIPVNDFYAVQTGAFTNRDSAEVLRAKYAERFGNAQLALKQGSVPLWRVLVGKEPSLEAAQQLALVLGAENKSVFVVRLDQVKPPARP